MKRDERLCFSMILCSSKTFKQRSGLSRWKKENVEIFRKRTKNYNANIFKESLKILFLFEFKIISLK